MHCVRRSSFAVTGDPFGYIFDRNGTDPELFGCTVNVKRTLPPCVVNEGVSSGLSPDPLTLAICVQLSAALTATNPIPVHPTIHSAAITIRMLVRTMV